MDLQLSERVVLVVGGTGKIGAAVVQRLKEEGATVVSASRSGQHDLAIDASDDASVSAGFTQILADHGRLDAVVVTAAPPAHTLDATRNSHPDQVSDAVAAKALAFLRVANAAIPVMRDAGFGRIVGISGQGAYLTGNITGAVRNAALIVIAKNLADELAGTGILVNTVNPGAVTATPSAEVAAGRAGESTAEQVADLVAFLASPLAATTGESIAVGHRARGVTVL
jgi:NAD(P)-dependent dehydrogenase (short-subunit alcohol dehydrogenase family)